MDNFDLGPARVARLRQYLETVLPRTDPTLLGNLLRLLAPHAAEGVDVIRLVEPIFGCVAVADRRNPPIACHPDALGFEDLPGHQRMTLWPYRPRIRPDELLSSWLWRVARGIGAPPKRFAIDAIGVQLTDVDREIDDGAIDRIAFLSGHSRIQLLRGTLRADVVADLFDRREHVQRLLLRHGDLVLNWRRGDRVKPIVQYCPVCLSDPEAYVPRGWRFSFELACFKCGCFLLDKCWRCGALLDPLAQTLPSDVFLCGKCGTPFASAPSLPIEAIVTDQSLIYERLSSLAFSGSPSFIGHSALDYIRHLSAGPLRGTNPKNSARRHNAVMLEARSEWSSVPPRVRCVPSPVAPLASNPGEAARQRLGTAPRPSTSSQVAAPGHARRSGRAAVLERRDRRGSRL